MIGLVLLLIVLPKIKLLLLFYHFSLNHHNVYTYEFLLNCSLRHQIIINEVPQHSLIVEHPQPLQSLGTQQRQEQSWAKLKTSPLVLGNTKA
jgi:hypothetical protein